MSSKESSLRQKYHHWKAKHGTAYAAFKEAKRQLKFAAQFDSFGDLGHLQQLQEDALRAKKRLLQAKDDLHTYLNRTDNQNVNARRADDDFEQTLSREDQKTQFLKQLGQFTLQEGQSSMVDYFNTVMMNRNEAQQEFDEKFWVEGEEPVLVESNRRLLFANGAIRDVSHTGFGSPPPAESFARLRLILRFYKVSMNRASDKFDRYQRKVQDLLKPFENQSGRATQPVFTDEQEQEHLCMLKALRAIVKDREAKYEKAYNDLDSFLNGTPEQQAHNAQLQTQAEAKRLQFLAQVNQVEV